MKHDPDRNDADRTRILASTPGRAVHRDDELIGRTISHYRIIEPIGAGGMGVVFRAEDIRLGRTVALKFLPVPQETDPRAKDRLLREAQAASSLDHPNICTVHEFDETPDGRLFIVMSCYEGETMRDRLAREALTEAEAVDIASQVAHGLEAAHGMGIVHRDIKPSNIFITSEGLVKILDFGIAKLAEQPGLTRSGGVVGTAYYLSPEVVRGADVDHRSDIWSLGVVLYEMLGGRRPFEGDTVTTVLYAIVNEDPQPLASLAPTVSEGMARITMTALAKDRRRRFQRAVDLAEALVTGVVPPPRPAFTSLANRVLAVLVVAAFVVAGVLLLRRGLQPGGVPSREETIAVVAFENLTGDPELEYLEEAIPNLIITNLEQRRAFRVLTWERLQDLRQQLDRSSAAGAGEPLGAALSRRGDIDAYIQGSLTRAGNIFAVSANLIDGRTGYARLTAGSRGQGVASILLHQIDDLTAAFVPQEDRGTAAAVDTATGIAAVATTSLEAYRLFLEGRKLIDKLYCADAVEPLVRATTLDSTFAPAHLDLARAYDWLHDGRQRDEALLAAMRHARRSPERDRLYIAAYNALAIDGDLEAMATILRQLIAEYPDEKRARVDLARRYYRLQGQNEEAIAELKQALRLDPDYMLAYNGLTYSYGDLGRFDEALAAARAYVELAPREANPQDSLGDLYFKMGRLQEARAAFRRAVELKPDFGSYFKIAYIDALFEEYDEARDCIDQFIARAPTVGVRAMGYTWRGFYESWLGRPVQAIADLDRAADLAASVGSANRLAVARWLQAWILCDLGEFERGLPYLDDALAFYREHPDWAGASGNDAHRDLYLGLRCLAAGELDRAEDLHASAYRRAAPLDSTDAGAGLRCRLALLAAAITAAQGHPEEAQCIAAAAQPPVEIKIVTKDIALNNISTQRDLAALLALENGFPDEAIATYEALVDADPNRRGRLLVYPRHHYRLAGLYDAKGWRGKALEHYRIFVEHWSDAEIGGEDVAQAREIVTAADRPDSPRHSDR